MARFHSSTPIWMMPMRRFACVLMVLVAGCGPAQGGSAAAPEPVAFAPALNVELGQMQRLPSGVYVRDLRVGEGAPARAGQRLQVHFAGWLPNGTQFDALVPPAAPVEFRLGERKVIRGWEEGLVGMRPGGQRQLVVPPSMGYGRRAVGAVPPNATLVFVIDLVSAR
jgi:FKBP-type peptidyl-prolyl cis-trans isomerase FkpA